MKKQQSQEDSDWSEFIQKTRDKPARPLLMEAVTLANEKNEALDLGAGALNATKYLLTQGFKHVTVVDRENLVADILNTLPGNKIEFVVSDFEHYSFPANKFDLVNAEYALPFNPPSTSPEIFLKIKQSLRPGGIFTGHFFGVRDEWNKNNPNMTFYSREEVENLLSGLEVLTLIEEEKDDNAVIGGIKYWHIFYIIAKKKD